MNTAEHFEAIVSEHYESLLRFALSLTRRESDACDLTQEAFYVWATKGHQLRDLSKVKTWLFTTLHRAFLKGRRREDKFSCCEWEEVADQLTAPSVDYSRQEDCSRVLPALARVDEVYRSAVALFYLGDHSYNDIAEILEVPLGTVKSRIARGLAQLQEYYFSNICFAESGDDLARALERRCALSASRSRDERVAPGPSDTAALRDSAASSGPIVPPFSGNNSALFESHLVHGALIAPVN